MILQALVRLAEAEGLVGDPGYEQRDVRWVIDIIADGTITAIHGPEIDDKKRPVPRMRSIPCVNMNKGSGKEPDSLVEKAEFCFGITTKKPEDAAAKHRNMLAFVESFRQSTKDDPGVAAMLRCLERYGCDPAALCQEWNRSVPGATKPIRSAVSSDELAMNETFLKNESALVAFRFANELVCCRPLVVAEVSRRAVAGTPGGTSGICSVTGKRGPLTDGHPDFALVATPGLSLVSFNTEHQAFQHLNRESLENAPISVDAAVKIGESLRRLVARDGFRRPGTDVTLPRRNWQLTSDTYALYWCESTPSDRDPLGDPWFASLTDPDTATPEQIEQCFRRPYRDGVPLELDPRPFHLLILARAKSRVVLRRSETKALNEVVRAVRQWAEDVRITPRFDHDKLGLWHLARATVSPKERSPDPPADLVTRLYACALNDRLPLPAELTAIVLRRIRSHDDGPNDKRKYDLTISTARVALLKASFNRDLRLRPAYSPIGKEFAVSLDLDHPHPSYHLGRLFAVLERIQGEAIDDINASICDRFLGQALAAPALVFPRLMKLSHHHLGKIAGDNAGRRVNLDKLVDEIVGRINGRFPHTQPLAEQGIFIIGYHHQRAAFFAKKAAVAPALTTADNA